MGNVFSGVADTCSLDPQWKTSQFAPLPNIRDCVCPAAAVGVVERQDTETYLRTCLQVLKDKRLTGQSVSWSVPSSVVLPDASSLQSSQWHTIWMLVRECVSEVQACVTSFTMANHASVSAATIELLLPSPRHSLLLWSPELTPLRANLTALDLSGCALGDDGVKNLSELLFPRTARSRAVLARPSTKAASSHGQTQTPKESENRDGLCTSSALPYDAGLSKVEMRLLPQLCTLTLDAVRLTDAGVEALCAHLEAVLRTGKLVSKTSDSGGADTPRFSSPRHMSALLPELSIRDNELTACGIVRAMRATLSAFPVRETTVTSSDSRAALCRVIGVVDVSWNSSAPLHVRGSASTDARCISCAGLGADLAKLPSVFDTSLLLRGCDLQAADMYALWVRGFLSTYLANFREAGKAAVLDAPHQAATYFAPLPTAFASPRGEAWAHLTRIDFSHNAALGNRGVQHFIQTLLAVEAARATTTPTSTVAHTRTVNQNRRRGLVPHALTTIEEISFRGVGCDDAVLPDVACLLFGVCRAPAASSRVRDTSSELEGATPRTHRRRRSSEDSLVAALRNEAHALLDLNAEETGRNVPLEPSDATHPETQKADGSVASLVALPFLKMLDLSCNTFSNAEEVAAVFASGLVRAEFSNSSDTSASMRDVADVVESRDGGNQEDPSTIRSANKSLDEPSFTLVMEDCALHDACLDAVPPAYQRVRAESVPGQSLASTCALYLGGNTFTHQAIVRLRRWVHAAHRQGGPGIPKNGAHITNNVVAYVEGNAILSPAGYEMISVDGDVAFATPAMQNVYERAKEVGIKMNATSRTAISPVKHKALFDPRSVQRVDWNSLPLLPERTQRTTTVTAVHKRHTSPSPRQSHAREASQNAAAPISPATPEASRFTVQRTRVSESPHRSAPSLGDRIGESPAFTSVGGVGLTQSIDAEFYIDEFIAEAERVMTEHEYLVRDGDGDSVTGALLSHFSQEDEAGGE